MPRSRYSKTPTTILGTTPFMNAEEAWFWGVRCQKARDQGMQFIRDQSLMPRPCYPDDIFRAVKHLSDAGRLTRDHLLVLHVFGALERSPDPRCAEEAWASRLWLHALDHLAEVLRAKEIVQ